MIAMWAPGDRVKHIALGELKRNRQGFWYRFAWDGNGSLVADDVEVEGWVMSGDAEPQRCMGHTLTPQFPDRPKA